MAEGAVNFADGSVMELTQGTAELQTVLSSATVRRQLVLLSFSVSWCGPCRMLAPVLHQLATEYVGRLVVIKCDCELNEQNRQLATEASISAYPTLHVYADARRVEVLRGADPAALRRAITQQLAMLGAPAAPGQMAAALAQALGRVKASCSFEEFVAAAKTLLTFVSNILAHPDDAKYKCIKLSNAAFQSKLGSKPGGKECMQALGFVERSEAMQAVLVMDHIDPQLRSTKVLLEQALAAGAAAGSCGAPAPQVGAISTVPTIQPDAQQSPEGPAAPVRARSQAMQPPAAGQPLAGQGAQRRAQITITPQVLARLLEKALTECGLGGGSPPQ